MTPPALHRLLLPLLAFCQLIVAIDYNIVLVALPPIGRDLGLADGTLQWVVSAYALAFGGALLLGGRLADTWGRRRMLLIGLGLYGVGSVAAGLAAGVDVVLVGRVVQGIGGALITPAMLAAIAASFTGSQRFRALSVWSAAGAVGLAAGSALGGVLTASLGWRSVFLINLPLVAAAATVALIAMPRGESVAKTRLDVPGAVLAAAGTVGLVLALSEVPLAGWSSPSVLVPLVVGACALAAFVVRERTARTPLLPLDMLHSRTLTPALLAMLLFLGSIGESYVVFTLYLQDVVGVSALLTGLAYLPWGITAILGSRLALWALSRLGLRPALILSLAITAAGTAGLALTLNPTVPLPATVATTVVLGAGQAMGFASLYAAAGTGIAIERQGVAAALMSTFQQVGTAAGIAVLGAVAVAVARASTQPAPVAQANGLQLATGIGAAVIVLALGVAALVRPAQENSSIAPTANYAEQAPEHEGTASARRV